MAAEKVAEKVAAGRRDRKGDRKGGYGRDHWEGKSEMQREEFSLRSVSEKKKRGFSKRERGRF